jgi:ubiquinone/menaquinone biosynthesis C-methylase UbiE
VRLIARFAGAFLRLLYSRLAFAYDLVAWLVSEGQWVEWAGTGLNALPAGTCLELGHGPGHLLVRHQHGRTLVGVDLSPQMTKLARQRLRDRHAPIRCIQARAQALPFAAEAFRGILATFPSEYIFDPRTVAEAFRVLQPGGTWVIVPQVRVTGRHPYERFLAWLYRITGETANLPGLWLEILHRQGFDPKEAEAVLPGASVQHILARKP